MRQTASDKTFPALDVSKSVRSFCQKQMRWPSACLSFVSSALSVGLHTSTTAVHSTNKNTSNNFWPKPTKLMMLDFCWLLCETEVTCVAQYTHAKPVLSMWTIDDETICKFVYYLLMAQYYLWKAPFGETKEYNGADEYLTGLIDIHNCPHQRAAASS